jgi:hypothetical protein
MHKTYSTSRPLAFEQQHKGSYTHGLEKIYSLESVDVSTVKNISSLSEPATDTKEAAKMRWSPSLDPQLSLPFGGSFRESIPPFVLREPIQMLELSKRVESHLLDHSKMLIGDLLPKAVASDECFKGLGQGHIDEVETKLQKYLEGTSIHHATSIDFLSWLKTLVGGVTPKKGATLLESWKLPSFMPLSLAEKWELQHLSDDKRLAWIADAVKEFQSIDKIASVKADLHQVIDVFIKPWVERRFGLARQAELIERLYHVSYSPSTADKVFKWLSTLYFEGGFPMTSYLYPLEEGLFAINAHAADAYRSIMDIALSYFYNLKVHYPLSSLVMWIGRECARKWHNFSLLHIEKVLRISPQLRVRKATNGELMVKLSLGF